MTYLILSIVFSSMFVLAFKYFQKYNINNFHAAVVNYLFAALIGFILNNGEADVLKIYTQDWALVAFILGFMFICMIDLIAITAQKIGVSTATVAIKTSLIIPVGVAVYLYNEQIGPLKALGILLAVISVFLVTKKESSAAPGERNKALYLLPVILFIASGITDSLIKYAQSGLVPTETFGIFISTLFAVAGFLGTLVVFYQVLIRKQAFESRSIAGGLLLGIVNYGTLYFLMKTLETKSMQASVIFPANNMGIVICSSVAAALLFKEKISRTNWIGILIALIAISLIAFA